MRFGQRLRMLTSLSHRGAGAKLVALRRVGTCSGRQLLPVRARRRARHQPAHGRLLRRRDRLPPAGVFPDLAHALGVTTDQLLGIKPVRSRTKKPQDTRLWRRFKQVEKLPAKERRQLLQLIDTFLEREKLRGNGTG